ncbi:MAG: hypothetical protein R3B47_21595 [Bacteroidia bacterium]
MKTKLIFILLAVVLFSSCKPDDTPDPDGVFTLQHDQQQFLSPFLPSGTFEFAARFEPSELGDAAGGKLFETEIYIFELPTNMRIKIYTGSGMDQPADLVHQQDITLGRAPNAWNTITLSDSVDVPTDKDLWIAVRFTQSDNQQIIGCDQGPAVANGDWFWDSAVGNWQTYREATNNATNVNWNIRGKVAK